MKHIAGGWGGLKPIQEQKCPPRQESNSGLEGVFSPAQCTLLDCQRFSIIFLTKKMPWLCQCLMFCIVSIFVVCL